MFEMTRFGFTSLQKRWILTYRKFIAEIKPESNYKVKEILTESNRIQVGRFDSESPFICKLL